MIPARSQSRSAAAFTLSEALIALGIIAVAAVLLLPVFSTARKTSQNSRCAHQLRQIGTGLMAWVADHQGKLIPAAVIRGNLYWFDLLNPYMGYPEYPENYAYPQPSARGTAFPLPWQQCPGQKLPNPSREAVGYGWNYLNFGHTAGKEALGSHSRIIEVTEPARTIIVGDSRDNASVPDSDFECRYLYSNDRKLLPRRHMNRGNYLMLDGHVESLSPEDLFNHRELWKKK